MPEKYEAKRRLERTPEPKWQIKAGRQGPLVFVVHKHAARRLHYDLRLELDGVLKSWAVPAGPSLNPETKRLAVMVEDHPLGYASFEGNIPEGEYGAGQVIVWDTGDYSPDEGGSLHFNDRNRAQALLRQGLADGKLSFTLRGQKLKGSWTLVKMKRPGNNWLLIKHQDDFADAEHDILDEGASVLSGATTEDLKAGDPKRPAEDPADLSSLPGAHKSPFPKQISPMLAAIAEGPCSNPEWLFEPKLDGYRIIAALDAGKVRLLSRNKVDVTEKYAAIAGDLKKLPVSQMVLDGEVIALDEKGKVCFQCLQGFLDTMRRRDVSGGKAPVIIYYVFDILYLDGYRLLEVPLAERKKVLERVLVPSTSVKLLEHFEGDGEAVYKGAIKQGLEGIIAKRKDSLYKIGQRSPDWLKIKVMQTDDFVIGGYTQGTGNRVRTFGALLLGYYDDEGRLVSVGHVGSGFDDRLLADIKQRLDALKTSKAPFAEAPELNAPATWVKPELVAEVKFSERTQDGRLRVPVFLRLRDDKSPEQVRHNQAENKSSVVASKKDPPDKNDMVTSILKQLENPNDSFVLNIGRDRVELGNLAKELWPEHTKRELLVYLTKVSPYFLKHLQDRPLTLSRYPGGIGGEHFFQKHWASPLPDFVATVPLVENKEKRQDYILCNNLPTLIWLGQVADIEFHSWFSRVAPGPDIKVPDGIKDDIEKVDFLSHYPDFIIFDFDPYIYSGAEKKGAEPELTREGFARTCEVALWLKDILDELGLSAFVKTSGMTGLHIYVPVRRELEFHAVRQAAKTICQFLLKRHSKSVTTDWAVEKRAGKVFLDYNQNTRGKTLASVYSPRPSSPAMVSTPLAWDELGRVYPTDFTIKNVPARLAKIGDLWGNILDSKKDLKRLLKQEV